MALPASYTEDGLAELMRRQLHGIADELGWHNTTPEGDYHDPVNATLRAYGVASIDLATDMTKLETLAIREVWRAAVSALTDRIDTTLSGQNLRQQQMVANAERQLSRAEANAAVIPGVVDSSVGTVGVGKIIFADDPYRGPAVGTDEYAD